MREFHAPDPAKGGSSRSISLQLEKAACRLAPMAGRNSPSQPDGFYGGVLLSKRGMRIRGRMPIERQPGVSASTAVSFPNGSAPGLASGLAVQCLRAQSFFLSDCARNFCIFTFQKSGRSRTVGNGCPPVAFPGCPHHHPLINTPLKRGVNEKRLSRRRAARVGHYSNPLLAASLGAPQRREFAISNFQFAIFNFSSDGAIQATVDPDYASTNLANVRHFSHLTAALRTVAMAP